MIILQIEQIIEHIKKLKKKAYYVSTCIVRFFFDLLKI